MRGKDIETNGDGYGDDGDDGDDPDDGRSGEIEISHVFFSG